MVSSSLRPNRQINSYPESLPVAASPFRVFIYKTFEERKAKFYFRFVKLCKKLHFVQLTEKFISHKSSLYRICPAILQFS